MSIWLVFTLTLVCVAVLTFVLGTKVIQDARANARTFETASVFIKAAMLKRRRR